MCHVCVLCVCAMYVCHQQHKCGVSYLRKGSHTNMSLIQDGEIELSPEQIHETRIGELLHTFTVVTLCRISEFFELFLSFSLSDTKDNSGHLSLSVYVCVCVFVWHHA